jgi:hypothetical protein
LLFYNQPSQRTTSSKGLRPFLLGDEGFSWGTGSHGLCNEISSSKAKRNSLPVMLYDQKAEESAGD